MDFITQNKYKNASPFPHLVVDNFFNEEELNSCVNAIQNNIDDLDWNQRDYQFQVNKRWLEDPTKMPPQVKKNFMAITYG